MRLPNKKLLIPSGPTRAPLDAVRYITNKATGRLGALIAEEAITRGAHVTFVYGRPSQLPVVRGHPHDHLTLIGVETIDDLISVFRSEIPKGYDAVIHPMAVLAYQSLKKNRCDLVVANDLREIEEGRHTGYFITPDGRVATTVVGKDAIARAVVGPLDTHLESAGGFPGLPT